MRLHEGDKAPAFGMQDVYGLPVALSDFGGGPLMLSFYRYSGCPFCSLRVAELMRHHARFEQAGLRMVAFWQSSREAVEEYVETQRPPFSLVPDPDETVYKMYGVEHSFWGAVRTWLRPFKHGGMFAAITSPYMNLKVTGDVHLMPADFLIAPDFTIEHAHYGTSCSDHVPIEAIERFLGLDGAPRELSGPRDASGVVRSHQ